MSVQSRHSPGFDPYILRHSGIWGTADEAVLNTKKFSLENTAALHVRATKLQLHCNIYDCMQGMKTILIAINNISFLSVIKCISDFLLKNLIRKTQTCLSLIT